MSIGNPEGLGKRSEEENNKDKKLNRKVALSVKKSTEGGLTEEEDKELEKLDKEIRGEVEEKLKEKE